MGNDNRISKLSKTALTSLLALMVISFLSAPAFASPKRAASSAPTAAIAIGEDSAVHFERNSTMKLPPASTTKLVTAMVAIDTLDPNQLITVSRNAACTSSVSPHLRPNETFTVEDMLHVALIRSVNSAAVTLAEAAAGSEDAFAKLMNEKVKKIGALNTKFINASGLPDEGLQYTTVYDLTLILKEALKYPLIKEILGKKQWRVRSQEGRSVLVQNTDRMLWATDKMVGGKTGYTRAARHCFVGALETNDGLLYTAVLGARSRGALWANTGALMGIGAAKQIKDDDQSADEPTPKKKAVASSGKAAVKAIAAATPAPQSKARQYASAAKSRSSEAKKRADAAKKKSRAAAAAKKTKTTQTQAASKPTSTSALASAR